jgi:hypothetical protein
MRARTPSQFGAIHNDREISVCASWEGSNF